MPYTQKLACSLVSWSFSFSSTICFSSFAAFPCFNFFADPIRNKGNLKIILVLQPADINSLNLQYLDLSKAFDCTGKKNIKKFFPVHAMVKLRYLSDYELFIFIDWQEIAEIIEI